MELGSECWTAVRRMLTASLCQYNPLPRDSPSSDICLIPVVRIPRLFNTTLECTVPQLDHYNVIYRTVQIPSARYRHAALRRGYVVLGGACELAYPRHDP